MYIYSIKPGRLYLHGQYFTMRILHTADWHIGKILHKQDLEEDILMFIDWLVDLVRQEKTDVLLVAGDIFDLSNPANRDLEIYYTALRRLADTGVQIIITGGNHDSVSMLNAASFLLRSMNITVLGGLSQEYGDHVIEAKSRDGSRSCAVLAVPFLRDRDLRQSVPAAEAEDRSKVIPAAVHSIYSELLGLATQKFGHDIPVIAMGHLFMKGTFKSDSEREIHIGNLEGLESDILPEGITYTALGHIHKPQKIGKKDNVRYSGSPVFLDFSEREYSKMVIIVEISEKNQINIREVAIPKFRDMPKVTGTLPEVTERLQAYQNNYPLMAIAEVEVIEKSFDPIVHQAANELINMDFAGHIRVIKNRISYADRETGKPEVAEEQLNIRELSPIDIFTKRLDETDLLPKEKSHLTELYNKLLEEIME